MTEALLIDEAMPRFDASLARHEIVRAAPSEVFAAALRFDFLRVHSPIVDAAMWVRGLPARLTRQPIATPPRLVLGEGDPLPGWTVLGVRPDDEIAFGAVGRFWTPNIEWRDVASPAFREFDEPGWGKIAANFKVTPYGSSASILTYECRTVTTDVASRRRFLRYWAVVRPFVSHILGATVRTIGDTVGQTGG